MMNHLKISFLDPAHSRLVHCVAEPLAVKSSNLAVVSHLVVDQLSKFEQFYLNFQFHDISSKVDNSKRLFPHL